VPFKVNCGNCEDLLSRGEIYNYKGKNLCEDCYILLYLFDKEAPDAHLPVVPHRSQILLDVGLRLAAKR